MASDFREPPPPPLVSSWQTTCFGDLVPLMPSADVRNHSLLCPANNIGAASESHLQHPQHPWKLHSTQPFKALNNPSQHQQPPPTLYNPTTLDNPKQLTNIASNFEQPSAISNKSARLNSLTQHLAHFSGRNPLLAFYLKTSPPPPPQYVRRPKGVRSNASFCV